MVSLPPLQQQQQQTPRDNISIAFQDSAYATPYGDNVIAGNHPGHRNKRLGRQYAPEPLNKSSLTTGLNVPGGGLGRYGPAFATDINNNVNHTLLWRDLHNSNYVLDAERGGRRHFDEGCGCEAAWAPSLRQLSPPTPEVARRAPRRRAFGMYSDILPDLEVHEMRERREREAATRRTGKAIVERRPDHHPMELGMCHFYGVAARPSPPDVPAPSTAAVAAADNATAGGAKSSGASTAVAAPKGCSMPFLSFMSPSCDETRMRGVYHGTNRQHVDAPDAGKGSIYAERRRRKEAARARLEEICLVQSLPK